MKSYLLKSAIVIVLFGILIVVSSHKFGNTDSDPNPEEQYEMKTYYMGFLKKGENRDQDSTAAAELQKAHLAHMDKLHKEGKLVMAGPFLDDGDIRGIVIYAVGSMEEAVALTEEDPAVKAGRLVVEMHPWYAAKGSTLP